MKSVAMLLCVLALTACDVTDPEAPPEFVVPDGHVVPADPNWGGSGLYPESARIEAGPVSWMEFANLGIRLYEAERIERICTGFALERNAGIVSFSALWDLQDGQEVSAEALYVFTPEIMGGWEVELTAKLGAEMLREMIAGTITGLARFLYEGIDIVEVRYTAGGIEKIMQWIISFPEEMVHQDCQGPG